MKKRYLILYVLLPVFMATATSCLNELEQETTGPDKEYKEISVSLDLRAASEAEGTPRLKVVDDPDDVQNTVIHNLCILQYDGTEDDSRLIGDVHFLRDDVPSDAANYLDLDAIKLADSEGAVHTLIILTNTYTRIPRVETLGQMLHMTRRLEKEADVFGHNGTGLNFPDDTDYFQRMNAIAVAVVDGSDIHAILRRSIARINVNITNTGKDGLQIKRAQLCNIPDKDYYVTDYHYLDDEDETELRDTFHDSYEIANDGRMNYPAEMIEVDGGAQNFKLTYYVPCNMRGEITNDNPSLKNRLRPSDGATYLQLFAGYGEDHSNPIYYDFYLGADLVSDFNINPNSAYEYNLSFDGKGYVRTDSRIRDYGGIDFDVDANCYMLKPAPEGTVPYSFNVVHRPNIFWGDRYGLHSEPQYVNNIISDGETWYARIIWSDFEMTQEQAKAFMPNRKGSNTGSYMDPEQRITVYVPSDCPMGNVLIGIYTDNPDNILWSWHLWITDYSPDAMDGAAPISGQYVYKVPGGEVHRYAETYIDTKGKTQSTMWAEGQRFGHSFIMDRFLGAVDVKDHPVKETKNKYYSFGRKDPFNSTIWCWTYDAETYAPSKSQTENGLIVSMSKTQVDGSGPGGYATNGHNVPFTVNHPTVSITGSSNWSSADDIFGGAKQADGKTEKRWNDPDPSIREEYEERQTSYENKSFFDPCPAGWRIPVDGCFIGFIGTNNAYKTENINIKMNVDSKFGNRGNGATYFPLGYEQSVGNPNAPTAFFPPFTFQGGYRYGQDSRFWSTKPNSSTHGYHVELSNTSYPSAANVTRQDKFSIRCIKEQ